jgi:predicted nucleic acid-binding protein
MSKKIFVDSNIWLYQLLQTPGETKGSRARDALMTVDRVMISHQVLVEVGANLVKKAHLPEPKIRQHLSELLSCCELIPVDGRIVMCASSLREMASLSYWDSLIIAAALESGCEELWSEDFQHSQLVDGRLRIINPIL